MGKLTVRKIATLTTPGMYADGATLYLRVAPGGSRQWVQRLAVQGKQTDRGLGGFPLVSINQAREKAFDNRRVARAGGDPFAETRKVVVPTFQEAAEQTKDATRARWRNGKTEAIWTGQLAKHVYPRIGNKRVDLVTREDVLRILAPVWSTIPEGARRIRQFMRTTFRWCQAHGYMEHNPAGEAIDGALPTMPAVKEHYRALPYAEVTAALRKVEGTGASMAAKFCLRFAVLTAVRSGEARGATWDEVDLDAREWSIPAERMKMKAAHVVPLSDAALAVLEQARILNDGSGLVFPSPVKRGRPLSNMTLTKVLRDTGLAGRCTVHGFRSSFRTWASERTNADHATMELALAHAVGSAVERSYARSDLLDKRRRLMDQWAAYLTGESAKVVSIGAGR